MRYLIPQRQRSRNLRISRGRAGHRTVFINAGWDTKDSFLVAMFSKFPNRYLWRWQAKPGVLLLGSCLLMTRNPFLRLNPSSALVVNRSKRSCTLSLAMNQSHVVTGSIGPADRLCYTRGMCNNNNRIFINIHSQVFYLINSNQDLINSNREIWSIETALRER